MPSRYAHDGFPTLRARLTSKLGTLMSGGEKWTGLNRLRAEWITIRNGIELLILSNIISREHREMGLQPEIKNWSACKAHTSAERLIPIVTLGFGQELWLFVLQKWKQPLATQLPFFCGFFVKFLVPLG